MNDDDYLQIGEIVLTLGHAHDDDRIATWSIGRALNGFYIVVRCALVDGATRTTWTEAKDNFATALLEARPGLLDRSEEPN